MQAWETDGISSFDPIWHGVGWGAEEEDQAYEPEPLDLDDMNKASATARQMATEDWYKEHHASPPDLQGVPTGLNHMIARSVWLLQSMPAS